MAGEITVNIGANATAFNSTLVQVQANARSTMSKVAENFANISVGIRNAFKGLKMFNEAREQALRLEDVSVRLAPLVGGLEKAKGLAESLRDEAANGTMGFEVLAGVAGRLASVFKSKENIQLWTTAFHDLAAGTGRDVNELIGTFVKFRAAGRMTGEIFEMFASKGINVFPALTAQTGKTEAELRTMAQEGKLAFSELERALLSLVTNGGQFEGAAKRDYYFFLFFSRQPLKPERRRSLNKIREIL